MRKKLFVIKKYIMASSAEEALSKERKVKPDDCWVDEEWKKRQQEQKPSAIGFSLESEYED